MKPPWMYDSHERLFVQRDRRGTAMIIRIGYELKQAFEFEIENCSYKLFN